MLSHTCFSGSIRARFSLTCLMASCMIAGLASTSYGLQGQPRSLDNPKHFLEPTEVTVFGPDNYIPVFGSGPGSVYGIESMGTRDVAATYNLWSVGDIGTTKQEWTDLYNQRVIPPSGLARTANVDAVGGFIHDGSAAMDAPTLSAKAPGYITATGNFYSFAGDYGALVNVSNYGHGGLSSDGGSLVILQTSAGINPDIRPLYTVGAPTDRYGTGYFPLNIVFTQQDGSALPYAAEILSFGINFAELEVPSSFGDVPWQELYWAVWLPQWDDNFLIDFGIPVHSAFSSVRVDTAIGTMNGIAHLSNFTAIPEPGSALLIGLACLGLVLRRKR